MLNILMLPHGNGFSRSDIHKLSNSLPQEAVPLRCALAWHVVRGGEDVLVPVSFLNALFYLNTVK